jgi:hypothetical protein
MSPRDRRTRLPQHLRHRCITACDSACMTSRFSYAAAILLLLAVETGIAVFVHDRFVRPYLGDSLAVVLVYLALRTVTRLRVWPAAVAATAFAFGIEFGQLFGLVDLLGLDGSAIARCLLGTGFDPWDFLAYLAGGAMAVAGERLFAGRPARVTAR